MTSGCSWHEALIQFVASEKPASSSFYEDYLTSARRLVAQGNDVRPGNASYSDDFTSGGSGHNGDTTGRAESRTSVKYVFCDFVFVA